MRELMRSAILGIRWPAWLIIVAFAFALPAALEAALSGRLPYARWIIGILWLAMIAGGVLLILSGEREKQRALTASAQAAALRSLEAQNRATLDSARANIAILDERGTIVDVNQSWDRFADDNGYATPDHGIGRNYLDACRPESPNDGTTSPTPAGLLEGLADVLAGRLEMLHIEYACHSPDKERWFEAYFSPLVLGRAAGAVARHIDVTERVAAEREVRKDSAILAAIDAVLPVIIYQRCERNGAWDYTFLNDGASAITGYARADLVAAGDSAIVAIHPDDRARVVQSYAGVVASGGGVWEGEFRFSARSGTVKWLRGAVYVGVRDGREHEALGILYDVTDERSAYERSSFLQEHDELTGLFSRSHFEKAVPVAVERWVRFDRFFAAAILDIDNFHEFNEAYGTQMGDAVLRTLGRALSSDVRGAHDVARIGDDKFGFIADVETVDEALVLVTEAMHVLGTAQSIGGHTIGLSVSAGVAVPRHFTGGANDLLRQADSALERARAAGGATVRLYTDEMGLESGERAMLREQLQEALDRREFELHYQPKIDLIAKRVVGCEALIRWRHPAFGVQAPGRFIPLAEQSGLIVPIGAWVIEEAIRQYAAWLKAGVEAVPIAVNVSAVQFERSDVFELIATTMTAANAPTGSLDIEVTESLFMDCSSEVVATLRNIRTLGVEIGLDDFGTGFSSFSYLKELPLSVIKADQSFVRGAVENASDAAIVRSIVHLTSELGIRVIAEGVETREQLNFVRDAGCAEAQGYYFSRPLEPDDFARYLADSRRLLSERFDRHA